MTESNVREDLERRLQRAKRMADLPLDPLTKERLHRLVHELEEQLRLSESARCDAPQAEKWHPRRSDMQGTFLIDPILLSGRNRRVKWNVGLGQLTI